ncbi:hypothetical protein M8523_30120 [Hyphomicrobiales bacterium BP6-180914]|uniref:Uncharacterized protein n=1 Tax=Lichenifustis flavocetrariae TaxID=2949735 RepID=A0AA41Z0Y2_9HYPH|nr:hypothetical protein [Lichenifustis flavocetrariae]MCW6512186.1 hypothetical protein [Lichenifustis flavocetrariae]
MLNVVKYAFPNGGHDSRILVTYEADGADWKLTISDNGVGKASQVGKSCGGLGTMIVDSLIRQLGATMDVVSGKTGVSVSIVSPTFKLLLPQAA